MPAIEIGNLIERAVITRLNDPTNGINAHLATICTDENYLVEPIIQFNLSEQGNSLYRGFMDPATVDVAGFTDYPLMFVYISDELDLHIRKPATFSGFITINLDLYIEWPQASPIHNFEKYANAVTAALYKCFNNRDVSWGRAGPPARLSCRRSAVSLVSTGNGNWTQSIHATGQFQYDDAG